MAELWSISLFLLIVSSIVILLSRLLSGVKFKDRFI
jgi:hypothetical protein